jgi:hypothetical protein
MAGFGSLDKPSNRDKAKKIQVFATLATVFIGKPIQLILNLKSMPNGEDNGK